MRTTLDIDDPLLEEIRSIQKEEGGSLGSVVSRLLADALESHKLAGETKKQLIWHSQPMDAKIDLRDKDLLYSLMDEG